MRVSLRWLRRWVPCLSGDIDAIGDALLSLGFPVESVEMVGIPAKHLHVGKIIQFEQHPRGDRLRICQVDVGEEVPRQIVCGANNFFQEDHVAVALPGCRMPDGTVIKVADFRGVRSHGMMCSGRELGISQDGEGLLILEKEIPIGTAVSLLFPELSDVSFDLEITSNRGDCMSHLGIARELAAYYNLNLAVCPENLPLSFADEGEKEQFGSTLRIQCDCEECTQFIAWEVRGVTVKESPQWLRDDLEHIGVRPVNNVVDVTNWLLADCGQPLHAFDKDKIHGGYLYIRRAYEGEKMVAIDHRSYALQGDMMVVCDSQKPLAIAGIMGSVDGEVDEDSKNLILESAAFAAESIQCTARKLGIVSGAAQRFSRGIDEAYVHICAKKAVQMLEQICGGEAATEPAVFSRGGEKMEKKTISIDGEFVRKKLGKNVADEEIENVLRRLYFQPQGRDGHWQVFVPSFRAHDVCTSIDLLEEFIRLYGIHQLPLGDVLMRAIYGEDDESFQFQRRVG
ncbi:MAG: phenylalanine--tRNA ligase subunit beta, partial [Puniceicoccales bacterium]|nr:phenylalanine--tRNA ligase subunit beta [Puniceicoccales bacterium]